MAQVRTNVLVRDLALAVGWAVFVGVGIALGLVLGSLGADVPADKGMLSLVGLVAGAGTLVVRLGMVAWKHLGKASPVAPRPEPAVPAGERPARARPRPVAVTKQAATGKPATTARKPATAGQPAAKKPAAAKKKPPRGGSPTRRRT